ncbi:uncharacterized protein LOC142079948 [Calonectris borealis]|uniref:uncharacterized protein LOC142079948 n=1 Tax=Calonectris borealis TaxID=1323832 RepID=UPI003F4C4042
MAHVLVTGSNPDILSNEKYQNAVFERSGCLTKTLGYTSSDKCYGRPPLAPHQLCARPLLQPSAQILRLSLGLPLAEPLLPVEAPSPGTAAGAARRDPLPGGDPAGAEPRREEAGSGTAGAGPRPAGAGSPQPQPRPPAPPGRREAPGVPRGRAPFGPFLPLGGQSAPAVLEVEVAEVAAGTQEPAQLDLAAELLSREALAVGVGAAAGGPGFSESLRPLPAGPQGGALSQPLPCCPGAAAMSLPLVVQQRPARGHRCEAKGGAGPQPVSLDVKIHIITPENAAWFCTPTPLALHPLSISDAGVLVLQGPSRNTCAFSRGDSTGTVLPVSRTQQRVEAQSEKAQATALQSVWAITPHQVIKSGAILAQGAGVTAHVLLEGDDTAVFLPYRRVGNGCTPRNITKSIGGGLSPSLRP